MGSLAKNIRSLRRTLDLTQVQLAELAQTDQSTVSAWEQGRAEPTVTSLLRVATALGCTLDDLVADVDTAYDEARDRIRQFGDQQSGDSPTGGSSDASAADRIQKLTRDLDRQKEAAREVRAVALDLAELASKSFAQDGTVGDGATKRGRVHRRTG